MSNPEKFWNSQAATYDKEEMKDTAGRAQILEKIKSHLHRADRVLDFGCATGIIANEIARDVTSVYGIDISPEMIQIAQTKAAVNNIRNADYSTAPITSERLKTSTFDVVLSMYVLHLLDDMPRVLKRIYDLLKPGGLFISLTPCLEKNTLTGMGLSLAGRLGIIPRIRMLNPADLESAIINAGFQMEEKECLQKKGQQYFFVVKKEE